MPAFSVRIQNLEGVLGQLDKLPDGLEDHITHALLIAASEAIEQIQEAVDTSYPPPSLPYMPPHTRTGTLKRSARIERVEPMQVTLSVGGEETNAPYASYLEFGTSKMIERPFVAPVVERVAPGIPGIVLEEINRGLPEVLR